MPTVGRSGELLVDTSVAVALVVEDHEQHDAVSAHLSRRRLGLSGHAALETFSVLTRLPPPARRRPQTVGRLLATSFPETRFLSPKAAAAVLDDLAGSNIAGGAVYDALVAACAIEHGMALATRDRRALETYRALDAQVELLT